MQVELKKNLFPTSVHHYHSHTCSVHWTFSTIQLQELSVCHTWADMTHTHTLSHEWYDSSIWSHLAFLRSQCVGPRSSINLLLVPQTAVIVESEYKSCVNREVKGSLYLLSTLPQLNSHNLSKLRDRLTAKLFPFYKTLLLSFVTVLYPTTVNRSQQLKYLLFWW